MKIDDVVNYGIFVVGSLCNCRHFWTRRITVQVIKRALWTVCIALCAFVAGGNQQAIAAIKAQEDTELLRLGFDGDPSDAIPQYAGRFPGPELVLGTSGKAWRSDGYSSAVTVPLKLTAERGFTIEFDVTLESYPSSLEKPVEQTLPASFVSQSDTNSGFDLWIDTFGRWGARVVTRNGILETRAASPFPLYAWSRVALIYDPVSGELRQYLNGKMVAHVSAGKGNPFSPSEKSGLTFAQSWRTARMGIFPINGLNAAFDNIRVLDGLISETQLTLGAPMLPDTQLMDSLAVPATRFAGDLQRPTYHAMPPANWTNEPHGLIRRPDGWHLFYQRTPNGPFKTQMHWGHMVSADLVHWTHYPDALWPTLQTGNFGFDMKGIWSGDVVTAPDGRGVAFYTSVNHSTDFFNPGIAMAVSEDAELVRWKKVGPVLDRSGFRDFRDPHVWHEDGEWRMIVGAALSGSGGGLGYYRCTELFTPGCWKRQPPIAPFAQMDIGSDIWEMPVLERLSDRKHILLVNPIGQSITKYGPQSTRAVYWIGSWDGRTFKPDFLKPKFLDLIPGHLSPTLDRDASGKLIGVGIVDERRTDEAQLAAGWAHTFGLPREWRLLPDGETLGQAPLAALSQLRTGQASFSDTVLLNGIRQIGDFGRAAELRITFDEISGRSRFGVVIAASPDGSEGTTICWDPATGEIIVDKSRSTIGKSSLGPTILRGAYDVKAFGVPHTFHVFIDHSVVDVFINDAAAFSFRIYPERPDSTLVKIHAAGNATARVEAWRLSPPAPK